MNLRATLASIGMPPRVFLVRVAVPFVATSFAAAWALAWWLPDLFQGPLRSLLWAIPLLAAALLIYYPFLRAAERRREIDRSIHFFITHFGVLATSNIPRAQVFRILGEKHEYGPIAREASRIATLVERWNVSLADAARFVAQRTPSRIFSDFLSRLAHALDSGEDLSEFLRHEQSTVMNEYANAYRRTLYSAEVFKTLYNSLVMSVAFLFIFAMLLPALTGVDARLVVGGVLILVLLLEAGLVQVSRSRAPRDPIWHFEPRGSGGWRPFLPSFGIVVVGLLAVGVITFVVRPPFGIAAALMATPLALVGWRAGRLEARIERRDENYGAFVRSLGASAAAHGNQVRPVLKQLQYHDFGPLRRDVVRLYRRLTLRANDRLAWGLFGAESDSHLVLFFNRMFEEGLAAGGKVEEIGSVMSENFARLVSLRKERYQSASTFRGLALGLVVALAAALAVGMGTIEVLTSSLSGFDTVTAEDGVPLPIPSLQDADLSSVRNFAVVAVLGHALAASLIVGIMRGSHPARATLDFVLFAWAAGLVFTLAGGLLTTIS